MERRRHPHYVRRTVAVTVWLIGGGLACLLLGIAVRGTAWRDFETILNLAFCGTVIALLIHWFSRGDSTTCPECGRRLTAEPQRNPKETLTFPCPDCQIEWDTGGLRDR